MGKETIIDSKLLQDITEFCKLNEIEDTSTFVNKLLRDAYMEFKWLDNTSGGNPTMKPQEEPKKEIKKEQEPETGRNFFGTKKNQDLYGE